MPFEPPDLGFAFLLSILRSAQVVTEKLAAHRQDPILADVAQHLGAAVARLEAHPDAPKP
jgi:hypothetical protein